MLERHLHAQRIEVKLTVLEGYYVTKMLFVSIVILIGTGCSKFNGVENQVEHIRNGDEFFATYGIGAIAFESSSWPTFSLVGSAVEIKDRCVLSTKSNFGSPLDGKDLRYYRSFTPITQNPRKSIRINRRSFRVKDELAVVWTKPDECTQDGVCNLPNWNPFPLAPSIDQLTLNFAGYGLDSSVPLTSPPTHFGIQKWGLGGFSQQYTVYPPDGGSSFSVLSVPDYNEAYCQGDNGGPVLTESGYIVGIMKGGATDDCATNQQTLAVGMWGGNYEWIIEQKDNFCKPKVMANTSLPQSMPGTKVVGMQNGQEVINCPGDCTSDEIQPYDITLTATSTPMMPGMPAPQFKNWSGTMCPCATSTNATCLIDVETYEQSLMLPGEAVTCEANW